MEALLAKLLGSKVGLAVGGLAGGLLLSLGFKIAKAKLPGILGGLLAKEIDLALTKGDPDDDALIKAVLIWVEKKIGPGKGAEKAALAAAKIEAITGGRVKKAMAQELVQAVFDKCSEVINSKTNA